MEKRTRPNALYSMCTMKCPRCRRGNMFEHRNPWNLRKTLRMPEKCPVCLQPFELEVGFWYGTAYVSYGFSFALSVATFVAWVVLIGISTQDNRLFYWLGFNTVFLVGMQPWIMRLSRVMYLYFFVRYDPDYLHTPVHHFE